MRYTCIGVVLITLVGATLIVIDYASPKLGGRLQTFCRTHLLMQFSFQPPTKHVSAAASELPNQQLAHSGAAASAETGLRAQVPTRNATAFSSPTRLRTKAPTQSTAAPAQLQMRRLSAQPPAKLLGGGPRSLTSARRGASSEPRAAVVLFGIHYAPEYEFRMKSWTLIDYLIIDYRWSLANYKKHIFDYLTSAGFETDVFFSTLSSEINAQLVEDYKPVRYEFIEPTDWIPKPRSTKDKLLKMRNAVELCLNYSRERSVQYDRVIVTRFDLIFREDFATSKIVWDTVNIVSSLKHKHDLTLIDDNFYAMPFSKLQGFNAVLHRCQETPKCETRELLPGLQGISAVNYIKDEQRPVWTLSWFSIVKNTTEGECADTHPCRRLRRA